MDIQTQSALLSAIVCLAIAVSIQIRGRRSRLHFFFVLLNVVYSVWSLSSFLDEISDRTSLWYRLSMLAALAIPWAALRFFQTLLGAVSGRASFVSAIISLLLVPFVLSPLYDHPWLGLVVLIYVFAILYLCIYLIYRRLRLTESRIEAARLWYLVIGGVVAVTFSLTDYLPRLDVFFPALGSVFTLTFMFFLSQILVQYRLLDLSEFFGKIAVLGLLVSLLAALYGALIWLVGDEPGILFFTSVVASFVVLILFEPLRFFVEARIARYGLRERFDFARQLEAVRREMANVLELGQMVQLLFERFENVRRITHASLFLLEEDAHTYKCIGHVGPQPDTRIEYVAARDLLDRLREGKWVVREEIEDDVEDLRELGVQAPTSTDPDEKSSDQAELERQASILATLDQLNAGVVFPIISDERIIGFLTLWDSRVREAFIHEELRTMQQVANQVAIVVENSKLVTKLRERDRLAALGEMAAGLAHEIRNPLGAIKGAAQLLDFEDEVNLEESREFLEVIIEEVDRLNIVVSQFLDYARPDRAEDASVELNPCIERTVQLLRQRADESEVELDLKLADTVPEVRGEQNRLTQVFLNLGLNAIEAMSDQEGERLLSISTGMVTRREPGFGGNLVRDVIEARFVDTGPGMSPETVRNVFIPFYTTKQSGTGLGLPICQRIVRGYGGTIEVNSEPGRGTEFSVQLPVWGEEAITGTSLRRESARSTGNLTRP